QALLSPLNVKLPLETERGYHIQIEEPGINVEMPVLHKGRGFSTSPMEMGLRFAGTVEIAGLNAPPNEQRGQALLSHARALYPNLKTDNYNYGWDSGPHFPTACRSLTKLLSYQACIRRSAM